MFVDKIKIHTKAGDGGEGCVSFRREKYVPKGGPDGGDGGKGGDILLEVDPHTDNLRSFFYTPKYRAERGHHGKGQRKTGKSGKDLVLKIPPGTLVFRADEPVPRGAGMEGDGDEEGPEWIEVREEGDEWEIGEPEPTGPDAEDGSEDGEFSEELPSETEREGHELLADLTRPGERFVLCRGGAGGLGNQNFATPTNRAPIENTPAEKGEFGWFYLELRQIADAGLVGFPNAGKSTLLRALSNAHPKVAAYPFTTLQPMIGVVEFAGFRRATVADIPGLIEGAHDNHGLGHEFLRHIMRCRLLIFVVDAAGVDNRDPISDLEILRKEIKLYDEELAKRPWLIVANKVDLDTSELFLDALRHRFPGREILPVSAERGDGLESLKARLAELIGRRPE
ncbi:MAG: GTPase ObgE [Akkermansiaceae bacterium]|nr:GTPase ObgE [Akkermansiaceae bacterium]